MTESSLQSFVKDRTALKKRVADGTLDLAALAKLLAVPDESPVPVAQPPLPAVISEEQSVALAKLVNVFGKVVPTEARALTPAEVNSLMDERLTIDEIAKLAEDRKAAIRTTVLNHFDTEAPDDKPQNREGHRLFAAQVNSSTHGKAFSWEVRNNGGTLDLQALQQLDKDGKIDHSLFLEMTTQVRVVDENKVMIVLKKHPELIDVLGDAVTKTSQVGSLYVRKAK